MADVLLIFEESATENTLNKSGCLPPFLDVSYDNVSFCLNNSTGAFAFETFLLETDAAKRRCLPPCTTNKIKLRLKNHQNMMDNFKTDKATNLKEYSLFFSFPTLVENVEAKKSYIP